MRQRLGKALCDPLAGNSGWDVMCAGRAAQGRKRRLRPPHRRSAVFEIPLERPEIRQPEDTQTHWSSRTSWHRALVPDEKRIGIEGEDVVVKIQNQQFAAGAGQNHETGGVRRPAGLDPLEPWNSCTRPAEMPGTGTRRVLERLQGLLRWSSSEHESMTPARASAEEQGVPHREGSGVRCGRRSASGPA